jgi:rhodanese-related sulfurtransferase
MKMSSKVARIPAGSPSDTEQHFARLLAFETDCSDVNHAIRNGKRDFVLLDVRSSDLFTEDHVPEAVSLPHWHMNDKSLGSYPMETLFVVYCAGPHCNGADKAAHKLATLGRPVKKMIGGVTGWLDEGLKLAVLPALQEQ